MLENDRLGGDPAALSSVTLATISSSHAGVTLDSGSGAVLVSGTTSPGSYSLKYRICEISIPGNCDDATVTLSVRAPRVITAGDDAASSHAGAMAIASVLSNDTLGGASPSAQAVTLSVVSSSDAALGLDPSSGAVYVAAGAAVGNHALVYRVCEAASSSNCDDATATVTVVPYVITAGPDQGSVSRSGGTAIASVLANDTFDGLPASLGAVTLSAVSSTNSGVSLNAASGSISVARGTAAGSHAVVYQVCETASPKNCVQAAASVTVTPYVVYAGPDRGRGSSKQAGTVVANVLANDTIGGMAATRANVKLSFVSVSPANKQIHLDLSDGSVDTLGKSSSGTYSLVYEICDIESATNCSRGIVAIDLSGR